LGEGVGRGGEEIGIGHGGTEAQRKTKQRGREARKQGSKEARKQGSKEARKQGSKEAKKQRSGEVERRGSGEVGIPRRWRARENRLHAAGEAAQMRALRADIFVSELKLRPAKHRFAGMNWRRLLRTLNETAKPGAGEKIGLATEAQRHRERRSKEAERQRGKEAKKQRSKEAKRQRGKETGNCNG
jgi:hypothetical protein